MANILIIDDNIELCSSLSRRVKKMGHDVRSAPTLTKGLKLLRAETVDIVLLDVRLPDGDGLSALPEIRASLSPPEVIIMTGAGSDDGAEMAIRNGAWDYLEKPFSSKEINLSLNRILQYRKALQDAQKPIIALDLEGIVGKSQRMKKCYDALAHAANSDTNVLITGETGTGKELFAKAIHKNSVRSKNNLVVVDCAAIPETLLDSILFGHQKGSFTGAERSHDGLIKQADKGSLFLDEIGELPLNVQKPFLRVLQEHLFRPVGGTDEVKSDFRLISATNRDLDKLVENGQFRQDLIYRLRSLTIELPPLRERTEDIKDLAIYFMTKLCEGHSMSLKGFSSDFFDVLASYNWPGNVRELSNTMERIFARAKNAPVFFPKHLPDNIRIESMKTFPPKGKPPLQKNGTVKQKALSKQLLSYIEFKNDVVSKAEKEYFEQLIAATRGNIKEACRISGLSRSRLYTLIKKYAISTKGWTNSPPSA